MKERDVALRPLGKKKLRRFLPWAFRESSIEGKGLREVVVSHL